MKIDFGYQFIELDGKKIPERPPQKIKVGDKMVDEKVPVFTLRKACVNVLLGSRLVQIKCPKCGNDFSKPEEISGDEKFRRYAFAIKIHNSKGLLDLDDEEIKLLKTLIGRIHPSMISGQAWQILDPHSAEEKK